MGGWLPFLSSMVTVSLAHFIRNLEGGRSVSLGGGNEGLGRGRVQLASAGGLSAGLGVYLTSFILIDAPGGFCAILRVEAVTTWVGGELGIVRVPR